MEDRKIYYVEKLYVSGNQSKKINIVLDDKDELINNEKGLAAFRFYERELVEDGFDRMIYGEKINHSKWIVMDQYYYMYDKNQISYSEYLDNKLNSSDSKVYKKV